MVLVVIVAMVWVMGWRSGFVFVIGRENEEWDIDNISRIIKKYC